MFSINRQVSQLPKFPAIIPIYPVLQNKQDQSSGNNNQAGTILTNLRFFGPLVSKITLPSAVANSV